MEEGNLVINVAMEARGVELTEKGLIHSAKRKHED